MNDEPLGLTLAEFAGHNAKLIALARETLPDGQLTGEQFKDYGYTMSLAVNRADGTLVVLETHAWSWDGKIDEASVVDFIRHAPGGVLRHLSDPRRPDHRG